MEYIVYVSKHSTFKKCVFGGDNLKLAIKTFNEYVSKIIDDVLVSAREYDSITQVELELINNHCESITLGLFELPDPFISTGFISDYQFDKMLIELEKERG